MKPASAFAVLLFSLFTVQSASAAVIGVRGGDAGSEDVTDGRAFELSECQFTEEDADQFYCVVYFNDTDEALYLLETAYWDVNGEPIDVESLEGLVLSEESDFPFLTLVEYLARFCLIAACEDPDTEFVLIPSGSFFRVFTDFKGSVSIQTWNQSANLNAAIPGQPIPEPATLLLLGLGVATVAGRRLRNRRN